MRFRALMISTLFAITSAFANQLPLRLSAVVSVGENLMCSVENTKTQKRYWLKEGQPVPGIEDLFVWRIHEKNKWVQFRRGDKSYAYALSGVLGNNHPIVMSVEKAGLSNMVKVFKEKEQREASKP